MPLTERQMDSPTKSLNVVDVYDIAASIGKEFETIIDSYGAAAVTDLMPKVINALEHLENLANRNQKENAEIYELKLAVERLQAEKAAKQTEREKYEKELEYIEESWRQETNDLVASVAKLQQENQKLKSALQKQGAMPAEPTRPMSIAEEDSLQIATKLKETVNRQKDQLRALQREISQKHVDLEAMQSQLERLAKLNADYRRKTTLTQRQATNLIQEKAELQTQLLDKEQQIQKIKESLHEQDSEGGNTPTSPVGILSDELSDTDLGRLEKSLHLEGKMVIDMTDPNRPRFTLNELREVLQERNELKTKLISVEEELQQYKPEDEEEDLPVQGPLPREPYDKLYPGKKPPEDSGIRKFFNFLFPGSKKSSGGSKKKY